LVVAEATDNPDMSAARIRWVAAAVLPLIAIAVLVVVTSGSDGDSKGPDGNSAAKPQAVASAEPTARSEFSDIYVVDLRTRKVDRLTSNEDEQFADSPAWSKTGRIVFSQSACEGCSARLFVSDPKGSRIKRIPTEVANAFQPSWSPDGRRIAVARPGSGIYVTSVHNGTARRLSKGQADEAPAWSPNGRSILFHRQVTPTNWDIYAASPSGGQLRRLTSDPAQQLHPSWSADGRKIALAEQAPTGNWVIYTVNADFTGRKRITDPQQSSQDPSWSPDGTRIAFVAQVGGRESVAVIGANGSRRTILTGTTYAVTAPSWSPDGRKIVFAAKRVSSHYAH
jgi:TolB protein